MSQPTPHALSTVAAIATAPGPGAIGIVRLSGPQAHAIGRALFEPQSRTFTDFETARLHLGHIRDPRTHAVLDQALVVLFRAPHSFTGEDVLEIHAHGGPLVLRHILGACLALGAEPAGPGEFSRRAFLHGKLDLAQAEAIQEAIAATSPLALAQAEDRLHGHLSQAVGALRDAVLALRAELLVAVDFPEEDLPELEPEQIRQRVQAVLAPIDRLLAGARRGALARNGALVVLAGRVNAGKSSLMNALLGRERAIVSALPGTTRDVLEEPLLVAGFPVRLTDTAGLRAQTQDPIEHEGIRRTQDMLRAADVVLVVLDATSTPDAEDLCLMTLDKPKLVVVTKMDLVSQVPAWVQGPPWNSAPQVMVSAHTGAGLDTLEAALGQILEAEAPEGTGLTPNERQAQLLHAARDELTELCAAANALPADLLAVHLDAAAAHLAAITGEVTTDEVLDTVFARFCIGK